MKNFKQKTLTFLSHLMHVFIYGIVLIVLAVSCFALYVKINTLDISFLIDHLKKEQIIDKTTSVEKLYLEFDDSFIIVAKNVAVKANNLNLDFNKANIEISRASLFRGLLAAKRIDIVNANINLNLDNILAAKSNDKNKKANYHAAIKQISEITKWTKSAYINNSNIDIVYKNEKQMLKDIHLEFFKAKSGITFSAEGIYNLKNNNAPLTASIHIHDNSDKIDLEITADNLKSQDLIKTFFANDAFDINGKALLVVQTTLNKTNKLNVIKGSIVIEDGFVAIPSLYDNKLTFKETSSNFIYNISENFIQFNKGKLLDKSNNLFNIFGDFNYKAEPTLNITAKTKTIDLLDAFKYIPDLEFTKWLDQHIYKGDASNVAFGFYGPLRPQLDGVDDNPYFDIKANFENVALTYLDGIPAVENAKGKFNILKKDININVESATHSKQTIERASVNIAPLFEKDIPLITIKALSNGSVEDVLDVLNKKLDLKQEKLFSQYKGKQQTQSTITLYLDRLNELDNYNPHKESFIKLNVRSDVSEVTGVDPVFNQRFQASDAIVNITEEDFTLEASGFMDENPFSIVLKEKLLEFGEHTHLKANSNFDSFLIKEYLQIPSFNLSGLVYSELELSKNNDIWNFNLNADLEDSLLNVGFLNYTKPFSKKGTVKAEGYLDIANNILKLNSSDINIDDAKANGSAKIILNNLPASTANFKNILIKDKTKLDTFTLQSNILNIKGDSLDLRPFTLAKKQTIEAKTTATEKTTPKKPQTIKKVSIRLKKLYLDEGEGLFNVKVLLNVSKSIAGLIKAKERVDAQEFYLRLTPTPDDPNVVKVESLIPDFGNYLAKSDIYDNMNAGHGILFGKLIFADNKFDYADLKLNVKRFQLLQAPLLAKALASISLEQLLTKKEGILFDDLYTQIHYEDSIIKLTNGKIRGPSLGILFNGAYDSKTKTTDLNGTLVPVVKLNSVVSNIPVLGYILTGSQGALSGADFNIKGSNGKQDVSVSPLSVITPGIVKDIFESVYSTISNPKGESKAIKKARKKANIESKPKTEDK